MNYINILNCNSDIGSCCNDAGLAALINVVRRVVELFQIIVPILLLTMLTFQLVKLVMNPEEKNGFKKITNRILAAVIIFFIPLFVNVLMNLTMATENFQLAACWNDARNNYEYQQTAEKKYLKKNATKDPLTSYVTHAIADASRYNEKIVVDDNTSETGESTITTKIVAPIYGTSTAKSLAT